MRQKKVIKSDSEFPDTRDSLLLHVQAGDGEAWHQFVDLYRPIIYRIARKRGLQDADAQDLAQQVLLSIAGAISRWKKDDESVQFRNWLRRIAKNAILNALARSPRDRASGTTSIRHLLEERVEDNECLAQEIELERRRELFCRAASVVKSDVAPDTWKIFELAVVHGLPMEEVASRLNKSVGTAYAARGRVMTRLRQLVEGMEQSE